MQAIQCQTKTDKSVIELVNLMEVALVFIEDADYAPDKLKSLEDTITRLLKEIKECCAFVRRYMDTQSSFLGGEVFASILMGILT